MSRDRVILCYGDSNTHGSRPAISLNPSGRHPPGARWPDAMAEALGNGWTVLNAGLPGRTTVLDDLIDGPWRNGLRVLPAALHTHDPLDLVILMLGTNDLKARHHRNAFDVADGLRRLIREIRQYPVGPDGGTPDILVICPAPIREIGPYAELYAGGASVSQDLPRAFAEMAQQMQVEMFDAGGVVAVDPKDGVHFSEESLQTLGRAIAAKVQAMFAG